MKAPSRLIVSVFVLTAFDVSAATLLVSLESTNPVAPFATWETAATNIQDAVDVALAGDTVLVTNGVYAVGSRDVSVLDDVWDYYGRSTRVVVTNSLSLESANGPSATTIDGGGGVRCVYLGTNAVLSGFTLTNGNAGQGGGVFSESSGVVTNCVLRENHADRGCIGWGGGGAYGAVLYNCTLIGNSAAPDGGGGTFGSPHAQGDAEAEEAAGSTNASGGRVVPKGGCTAVFFAGGGALDCTLRNCTLSGNSADSGGYSAAGGAVFASTLYNCTLVGNSAGGMGGGSGGGASWCTLYNCVFDRQLSRIRRDVLQLHGDRK